MKAVVLGRGKSGEAAAKELVARGYEVEFVENAALVVTSPGIPVKSELQFGCEALKRLGWKLVAVTGSKGKSSVVKLCAEALHGVACGNYGRPVSDLIGEEPGWAVVEVSSFQLETTTLPPDTFEAAAILNLQEDHLDRHGSVEVYHGLKKKLLTFAKRAILPAGSVAPTMASMVAGSYFDNEVLRENAGCAIELLRTVGLREAEITRALREFRPLPHRFEQVAEIGGVRYVDDSKATSIAALIAGVRMCGEGRSVRLIAGGRAKGDDPMEALACLTSHTVKVYIIGECANTFHSAWREAVDCEICGTLEKAVERAKCEAEKGDWVLLSPGTASYDQFKSFGERGEVFAGLVKKGKNE